MKVIQLKNKRRYTRPPLALARMATEDQKRQRELSWLMYVTEGFVANLYHLKAVNSYTMRRDDLGLVQLAIQQAEGIARSVHAQMNNADIEAGSQRRTDRREAKLEALQPAPARRRAR